MSRKNKNARRNAFVCPIVTDPKSLTHTANLTNPVAYTIGANQATATQRVAFLESYGYHPADIRTSDDIKSWNAGSIPIALIHPASAGHGINIQRGGHILIWFGLTWSLELYQQTNARLWRQGQQETVIIQHIMVRHSIDEKVMKALSSKDASQERLIAAVRASIDDVRSNQVLRICPRCSRGR